MMLFLEADFSFVFIQYEFVAKFLWIVFSKTQAVEAARAGRPWESSPERWSHRKPRQGHARSTNQDRSQARLRRRALLVEGLHCASPVECLVHRHQRE